MPGTVGDDWSARGRHGPPTSTAKTSLGRRISKKASENLTVDQAQYIPLTLSRNVNGISTAGAEPQARPAQSCRHQRHPFTHHPWSCDSSQPWLQDREHHLEQWFHRTSRDRHRNDMLGHNR